MPITYPKSKSIRTNLVFGNQNARQMHESNHFNMLHVFTLFILHVTKVQFRCLIFFSLTFCRFTRESVNKVDADFYFSYYQSCFQNCRSYQKSSSDDVIPVFPFLWFVIGVWFVRHALKNQYKNIKYNSIGSKALLCLESSFSKRNLEKHLLKGFYKKQS